MFGRLLTIFWRERIGKSYDDLGKNLEVICDIFLDVVDRFINTPTVVFS